MKIQRVKTSFVASTGAAFREGDLVPDNHPVIKAVPGDWFEPVESYVARTFPGLIEPEADRKPRRGRGTKATNHKAPPVEQKEEDSDGEE